MAPRMLRIWREKGERVIHNNTTRAAHTATYHWEVTLPTKGITKAADDLGVVDQLEERRGVED